DVFLALGAGIGAFAVDLPVRDAVNGVRNFLLRGLLQASPDKLADVILDRGDLLLRWVDDILAGDERGLAKLGIVASNRVGLQAVKIVRAAQNVIFHVPLREQAVVPLGGIGVLLVGNNEGGALLEEALDGFGDEELEREILSVAIADVEHILAELAEVDLVDVNVFAMFAKGGDLRLFGVLGIDLQTGIAGVEGEFDVEVGGHSHARDDGDIEQLLLIQHLANTVIIRSPAEPEAVGLAVASVALRRQDEMSG